MARQHPSVSPIKVRARRRSRGGRGGFRAWIEAWYTTCRAYYRAAITYEDLRRLPEAELRHLGYRRPTLARDVTGFDITHPPGG